MKKWYHSRTIWTNALAIGVGVTPLVSNFEGIITPTQYAIAVTVLGAINVVLRVITTQPLEK